MNKKIISVIISSSAMLMGCNEQPSGEVKHTQEESIGIGSWQLRDSNDTGDRFFRIELSAKTDSANMQEKPVLAVGCSQYQLEGINPSWAGIYNLYEKNISKPVISYSFDNKRWIDNFDWKAPITLDTPAGVEEVDIFNKSLLNKDILTMKIWTEENKSRVITFDIQGYVSAVKDIRLLCDW